MRFRTRMLIAAGVLLVFASAEIFKQLNAAESAEEVPSFRVDATWPKLPGKMIYGEIGGIDVDAQDHIWVIHRLKSLNEDETYAAMNPPHAECCVPAPAVMEFDTEGNYIQGWGGPGPGYDWPENEHGIHADYKGNIWVGGSGQKDNQILKFDKNGKFLLQIGHSGPSAGSDSIDTLGKPDQVYVDPKTNEVFVADGDLNRRVIVFDADTGAYKRQWGAYGKKPDDSVERGPRGMEIRGGAPQAAASGEVFTSAEGPWLQQFNTVHAIRVSKDQLVYVGDRANDRVQVFRPDGTFVNEVVIDRRLLAPRGTGTAGSIAFSSDPGQRFMYVADSSNNMIWILNRQTLKIIGTLGRQGRNAGMFYKLHFIATDSHGNLYTAEAQGRRAQKFVYQGLTASKNEKK